MTMPARPTPVEPKFRPRSDRVRIDKCTDRRGTGRE